MEDVCNCGFLLNPNGWCEVCKVNRHQDGNYVRV